MVTILGIKVQTEGRPNFATFGLSTLFMYKL